MKLTGEALRNTIGNVAERFACADFNTGYSPATAAVTAPTQKPTLGLSLN